ncbi:MAG: efflux RND transporter periplasmic adaptor subunit [Eubacteriales bacterium]|nr:efflux RND transporter periplasmic adaptor subunit [Eubacteriales bacterium]
MNTTNEEIQQRKQKRRQRKRRMLIAAGGIAAAGVIAAGAVFFIRWQRSASSEVTYRETAAVFGDLAVGVTESGEIAIGSSEQTFDLDLSAYSSSSSAAAGGMGDMGGGFPMTLTGSGSTGSRTLEIEEVYVTEGQEISVGDPLLRLEESSVDSIRNDLTEDVSSASLAYQQAQTNQKSNDLTAKQNYAEWTLYGSYAQAEYDAAIADLQSAVDTAQEALLDEQDNLTELQEELAEKEAEREEYEALVANGEYQVANTSREDDLYNYMTAENGREEAQALLDAVEDEIEALEDEIETSQSAISQYQITVNTAMRDLESGTVSAQTEYETKLLYYNNAESYYTTSLAQNALITQMAQEDYTDAQEKLDEFDSAITQQQIVSSYNGVVSSVSVAAGDTLQTGTALITVNDYDDVTVTVSVSEDDISSIAEGDSVNIMIDAYPDGDFSGTVNDIGDSSYNSSTGETTYEVEVLISGANESLYNGMTTEVTFVTKETREVLYVSNRAITRRDGRSYVKMYDENGDVTEREVTTGFSDGTNVEIKEGLSEGDTVLIESSN